MKVLIFASDHYVTTTIWNTSEMVDKSSYSYKQKDIPFRYALRSTITLINRMYHPHNKLVEKA